MDPPDCEVFKTITTINYLLISIHEKRDLESLFLWF